MNPPNRSDLIALLCVVLWPALAGVHADVSAAPDTTTSSIAPEASSVTTGSKPIVINPMRVKEPMSGEMKRDGMLKEDVRKQAIRKDQMMRDAMKKEEMKK